jgi:hypothetical protein
MQTNLTKKSLLWVTIVSVTINFMLSSCKKDDPSPKPVTIDSFTPATGPVGATVNITGTNFSTTPANNIVTFNGTAATVSAATATQLTVTVPIGATTGKISVAAKGVVTTSITDFIVLQPPTITSFAPAYALPGATITITGTNFSTTPANNVVTINGVAANVTAATATQLTITVPANATTGKIAVSLSTLTVTSANDFEVLKDIPRSGLVAFYPFNGNANDESENNLNGTLNGPSLTANRFGTVGRAYNFNGTSDFITMGNPPLLQINNTITLSGWINIDAFKETPMMILSKISFSPNRGYLFGSLSNDTRLFTVAHYSSVGLTLTNNALGSTISASTWIFFTLTIDGKSWKFYQNGVFTHGATVISTVNILDTGSQGDLLIGQYGGGDFFDGSIDDIAIYNRALSDTEVTQLYNQTVSKY